jgi:alanine-synthesizing transaminase
VHPNNPTGHYTKRGEIAKLNAICSARGLAIIADEVFLDFSLEENAQPSFAVNRDALTFTLSGLSKICGLPQMKAAWLAVSGPQHGKADALVRLEMIADTYLSVNAPVQLAVPRFLEQRHTFQKQVMSRVRRNLAELDRQLALQKVVSRLTVEGGWCAVLRIPRTGSDEDLAITLLNERGLYVHPGHFYDFATEQFLVLSLLVPGAQIERGVAEILALFR